MKELGLSAQTLRECTEIISGGEGVRKGELVIVVFIMAEGWVV